MHGGDPDKFKDLNADQVQLIYTTYAGLSTSSNIQLVEAILSIFKRGNSQ